MAVISRLIFAFAGGMLVLMAIGLIGIGVLGVIRPVDGRVDTAVLDAIGYLVIAIAVFDVAKYLIEEEVVREREMRQAGEARRSLTRFIATVIIATLLEALVIVFKVSRERVDQLIYPGLLMFAAVGLLVGLGAFQRLSASVERAVGEGGDQSASGKAPR